MARVEKFLNLAREISRESPAIQQKMGSVIVKSGKVISVGVNHGMTHAETSALKKHMDYRGCDIFVMRWNSRVSKPCPDCEQKIIDAGINRCYYISIEGDIVEERFGRYSRLAPSP